MKNHGWRLPPLGANVPASQTLRISAGGTGSGRSRRIASVVLTPSSSGTSSPIVATSIASGGLFTRVAGLAWIFLDGDDRRAAALEVRSREHHPADLLIVEVRDLSLAADGEGVEGVGGQATLLRGGRS